MRVVQNIYDIKTLAENERSLKSEFKAHFAKFFREFSYENFNETIIKKIEIESYDDISSLRYGTGLYFILTDYMQEANPCALEIGGLKVLYRGHGCRIKKRVESHLFNSRYRQNRDGTNYTVCMKINGDNGINLNHEPYASYRWAVIQHPMTGSSKVMREQAEQAFDEKYNRPLGSNA